MKEAIYFYSDLKNKQFIKNVLVDFRILYCEMEELNNKINEDKKLLILINSFEVLNNLKITPNNNTLIFVSSNINNNFVAKNVFFGQITIDKFRSLVESAFKTVNINILDIKLDGNQLINKNNQKNCYLTDLEIEIFKSLVDKKEIEKRFIKENILKINNSIQTKSPETHISRIRKKLLHIGSLVQIKSKKDKFLLSY